MKKRSLLLSLTLLLTMSLVTACGGGNNAQGGQDGNAGGGSSDPSQLIIATGGTGGTYYPLGGGMADLIKKNTGVTATATSNRRFGRKRPPHPRQSSRYCFHPKRHRRIRKPRHQHVPAGRQNRFKFQAMGALYNETIQIVVAKDSNIKSVADLKGKRVSVGSPGSGTEMNAQQILEVYGLTFDDLKLQRLSFADSARKPFRTANWTPRSRRPAHRPQPLPNWPLRQA
jgi:TRAP-type uncharacterized transport system substrate-binding protein